MTELIKVATPMVGDEEIQAVTEVLRSGNYVSGEKVKQFEEKWASYIGTDYAVAVDTGTDAIRLTLDALDIGDGDAVIVPALTFFATASAVLMNGGIPIFGDIDPDTYNLDPDSVEKLLEKYKARAIMPVHYFGHPADMDRFKEIAEDHHVLLIEDAAQAHGAEYKGKKVGGLSEAGCWSYYATKNLTVATEGGMITTNIKDLAEVVKILRNHGMTDRDTHGLLGGNNRMSEIGAAIGLVQLKYLDGLNRRRTWNSLHLRKRLQGIPWLKIPPVKEWAKPVWFWCPVEVDEEKLGMTTLELRKRLYDEGVETRHRYTEPLYRQRVLEQYRHLHDYSQDWCPVAERVCGKILGLPNHPMLTQRELDRIVEVIKSI